MIQLDDRELAQYIYIDKKAAYAIISSICRYYKSSKICFQIHFRKPHTSKFSIQAIMYLNSLILVFFKET